MKKIISIFCFAGMLAFSVFSQERTQLTIKSGQEETIISKHIYGHFAEHLGRCIYGGFYVGEDETSIPHTDGVRNDVIEALKDLKIPNLRWPGGCFADTYHWMDGIGSKSERPSIVNKWWGGVTEDNSFGTHDFLNMCELLDTEPYLSGNVGSGTVKELSDWIQYTTHNSGSPMANLRKQNGREEPWNVKYWGVGNEAWGCGGNMTAEYYANVYRQYATYMQGWSDNGQVFRIASGASSDDYNWTETLMKNIPGSLVDGLALHHYSVIDWGDKGPDSDFTEGQYFNTLQEAWKMEELITRHVEIMDKYDPENKIALIVDEWGGWYDSKQDKGVLFQQNTMRDAMLAGITLNIFNNHADRVKMANLAQAVNVLQAVILTDEEKMLLTPTYHVMKMYTVHHDATLIPLEVKNNLTYSYEGEELPAISASASKNSNDEVHFSIVNIHATQSQEVELSLEGLDQGGISATILRSDEIGDLNTFDHPNKVSPSAYNGFKKRGNILTVQMPPCSVVVLEAK